MVALVIKKKDSAFVEIKKEIIYTLQPNVMSVFEQESTHESVINTSEHIIVQNVNLIEPPDYNSLSANKGEFSIAKYCFKNNEFTGIRDRVGVKPFFYYNSTDIFVYSTSISLIKTLIKSNEINTEWVARSLSGIPPKLDSTFYENIKQLPPAHILRYKDGYIGIKRYWELQPKAKASQEYFSKVLFNAVKFRVGKKNASELSGGLDSSGVLGILSVVVKDDSVAAFRHVMEDKILHRIYPFSDERMYSQAMADFRENIRVNNVTSDGLGIIEPLILEMKKIGSPFFSSLPLFSDSLYDKSKQGGVDVLFSGFGGDEGVSSSASYYLWELAYSNRWKKLKEELAVNYYSRSMINYWLRSKFSFLNTKKWTVEKWNNSLTHVGLIETYKLRKQFEDFHNSFETKGLNLFIRKKIENPAVVSRLEENGRSLRSRGIEFTHPLLDTDLLETYLSLPSGLKYNKKTPRFPYREAIKNFVPRIIYTRKEKTGATVPTVFYRFMNDYDKIEQLLQSNKNGEASAYVNIEKMLEILPLIKKRSKGELVTRLDLRMFIVGLQMILYFDIKVID